MSITECSMSPKSELKFLREVFNVELPRLKSENAALREADLMAGEKRNAVKRLPSLNPSKQSPCRATPMFNLNDTYF